MPAAVSPERESFYIEAKGAKSPRSLSIEDFPTMVDTAAIDTASKILAVIDRYRLQKSQNAPEKHDEGALKFLAVIYSHVRAGKTIPMCLPAFPFKSPNKTTKCLGKLPDRAEELALAHLNGLCMAIQDVYPPGALLTIISDGLVYNDLLGVPDKDVWNYGETLRKIAKAKGFTQIEFSRLRDLVSLSLPEQLDEMTYVANASNFRRALLNTFANPNWEWNEVSKIEDVCLTYRGYIKFLETDLADVYPVEDGRSKSKYKRGIEYIAKQMMCRGDVSGSFHSLTLSSKMTSMLTIVFTGFRFRCPNQVQGPRPSVYPPFHWRHQAVRQPHAHDHHVHDSLALHRRLQARRHRRVWYAIRVRPR